MKRKLIIGAGLIAVAFSGACAGSYSFRSSRGTAHISLAEVVKELQQVALTGEPTNHCSLNNGLQRSIHCSFHVAPDGGVELPLGTGYDPYDRCDHGEVCDTPRFWYEGQEYRVPVGFRVLCVKSIGHTYDITTGIVQCMADNRPPPLLTPPVDKKSY